MTRLDDLRGEAVQRRAAVVEDVNCERRELLIRAAPYDVESDIGGGVLETFAVGTFARAAAAPHRLGLWYGHGGPLVGRGTEAEDRPDGFWMRTKVSQTSDGRDLLQLVEDGVLTDASVEFVPQRRHMAVTRLDDGRVRVQHRRALLRGCAVVFEGAHPDARIVSLRDSERDRVRDEAIAWAVAWCRGVPDADR